MFLRLQEERGSLLLPPQRNHELRREKWLKGCGMVLAQRARCYWDEHGSLSGEYRVTRVIECIPHGRRSSPPLLRHGRRGVGVDRGPEEDRLRQVLKVVPHDRRVKVPRGRNEAGTYFSHPVHRDVCTVREAIRWMWGGREHHPATGDIALIVGNGPKLTGLPDRHVVDEAQG